MAEWLMWLCVGVALWVGLSPMFCLLWVRLMSSADHDSSYDDIAKAGTWLGIAWPISVPVAVVIVANVIAFNCIVQISRLGIRKAKPCQPEQN